MFRYRHWQLGEKKTRYIPSGETEKKIQSLEFSREFDTRTDIKEKWKKKLQ